MATEVFIDGITHDGRGVGRYEGQVAFITGGIPGERVSVPELKNRGRFLEGEAKDILEASPDRVKAPCPYFGVCGGCQLQHISYERQLELKQRMFKDAFRNNPVPGLEAMESVEPSPEQWHYRNKVSLHTSGRNIGYFLEESHQLLGITECPIGPEGNSQIIKWWQNHPLTGTKNLTYRINQQGDRLLLAESLEAKGKMASDWTRKAMQELKSLSVSVSDGNKKVAQSGRTGLEDEMLGLKYRLSPVSFAQVNSGTAAQLYAAVIKWVQDIAPERLIEAYCGIGVLSLLAAPLVDEVYGLEISAPAVWDAEDNAQLNHITNARFIPGPCEETLPPALKTNDSASLLVVDPPRAGLSRPVLEAIVQGKPDDVIYISCNPATLARDLKYLHQNGYKIDEIKLFDMFPQTAHLESCVLLTRY